MQRRACRAQKTDGARNGGAHDCDRGAANVVPEKMVPENLSRENRKKTGGARNHDLVPENLNRENRKKTDGARNCI